MNYTALIGNPVEHSVSDVMFKLFADKLGMSYAHLKIKVEKKESLQNTFTSLNTLNFKGINITLPYKVDSLGILDIQDNTVKESGAVNTVKFQDNRIIGFNTDCLGFIESCEKFLKPICTDDIIFLFGAGGAARAIIQQLTKFTKNIYVFNREFDKLNELRHLFKNNVAEYLSLDTSLIFQKIKEKKPNYFINATSLGMKPNIELSPLEQSHFHLIKQLKKKCYFLDAVFNPYETRFLKEALENGHIIVSGIYWMIFQGVHAFNIWNDTKLSLTSAEVSAIAQILEKEIKKEI